MRTDALTSFFTSLFQDSSGITIAATIIRPDELNDMGQRHAFEAMIELSESGKPVDIAHVCDKLQARGFGETQALELLERLTDGSPLPGAIRDYAALIQKAVYKKRLGGLLETASLRNQAHDDPEAIAADLLESLTTHSAERLTSDIRPSQVAVMHFLDKLTRERQHTGELEGLPTGISSIDEVTTGVRGGELWVLGALPGKLKTGYAIQVMIENVQRGNPVLFFSLEMPQAEIVRRICGSKFGASAMRQPRFLSEERWTEIQEFSAVISKWPMFIDESASLTATALAARARMAIRQHNIKLVIVDYLQLLGGPEKEIRERVGNATNILRQLAKTTGVPVIALSQLRRPSNINDRPSMIELKESGDVEAHANTILLMYQPIDKDGQPTGEDEIVIAKQRNGPQGSVPVACDRRFLLLKPRGRSI